ncbi:MAG: thio(seleno)oxazole modification radical SAM maturase SbtM [Thermodesulfovibrionales bacterium]
MAPRSRHSLERAVEVGARVQLAPTKRRPRRKKNSKRRQMRQPLSRRKSPARAVEAGARSSAGALLKLYRVFWQDGSSMSRMAGRRLDEIIPVCASLIREAAGERVINALLPEGQPEEIIRVLERYAAEGSLPAYLPDLGRLELTIVQTREAGRVDWEAPEQRKVNPTLNVVDLSWRGLPLLLNKCRTIAEFQPERGEESVFVWVDPRTREVRIETASPEDLLPLKIVVEGTDIRDAAKAGGVAVSAIETSLTRAIRKGLILAPLSKVRRNDGFPLGKQIGPEFLISDVFTLQWHITQACDLRCKHCYDRSARPDLSLKEAYRILDDLFDFCRRKAVQGQVSFSGGNPFLHPDFKKIYSAAAERGFALAILGNPVQREQLQEVVEIEKPVFFQVSLEGLERHNDLVRGEGHFQRTLGFLDTLREIRVYSMVMLTLTKDNMSQVIPLAGILRDRTDLFTFNRLALFGEGKNLMLPSPEEFRDFLSEYLEASRSNPVMALKDNLFNILHHQEGEPFFGGCAGYGCGAAFNFLALLPDGEVHACRKLPSLIGNITGKRLEDIYDSDQARRYRAGCSACSECPIRPVCGGCLAVASSLGLDPFGEKDPYCFIAASGYT